MLIVSSPVLFLDTIYARCDNFVPMKGEDDKFEYQISTEDTKSWFDSVRACKVKKKQSSSGPHTPLRKRGEIQTTIRVKD